MNHIPFDSFERSASRLRKKYHHFDEDFKSCLDELLKNPPTYSDPIPAYAKKVWKARLRNTDQQKGKSGGYRFIFYFDELKPDNIYGLDIYPKSEREDIPVSELVEIYKRFILFLTEALKQRQQQQPPQPPQQPPGTPALPPEEPKKPEDKQSQQ